MEGLHDTYWMDDDNDMNDTADNPSKQLNAVAKPADKVAPAAKPHKTENAVYKKINDFVIKMTVEMGDSTAMSMVYDFLNESFYKSVYNRYNSKYGYSCDLSQSFHHLGNIRGARLAYEELKAQGGNPPAVDFEKYESAPKKRPAQPLARR